VDANKRATTLMTSVRRFWIAKRRNLAAEGRALRRGYVRGITAAMVEVRRTRARTE